MVSSTSAVHPTAPDRRLRRSRSAHLVNLIAPKRSPSVGQRSLQGMCEEPLLSSMSPSRFTDRLRGALSRASHSLSKSNTFHGKINLSNGSPKKHQKMSGREAEVALRYLREVIRSEKIEMISACTNAIFDAVANGDYDVDDDSLKDALVRLLQWADRYSVLYEPGASELADKAEALDSVDALEKLLRTIPSRPQTERKPAPSESPPATKTKAPPLSERSSSLQGIIGGAANGGHVVMDKNLDDLMCKLNLRQVAKFEPVFPDIEADSDDDVGVTVSERKEEREEKHGEKTCEEEVEVLPDGSQITRKKTRTVNVSQSSKHIRVSTRGGGLPGVTRDFHDGTHNVDDDEDFEKTTSADFFKKFNDLKAGNAAGGDNRFALMLSELDKEDKPSMSTKTKTIEKTSEVLQSVAENKKKNGRVLADNAAHQLDTTELKAKQIETFMGDKLLDRKGDGSYEEATIIKQGLPGQEDELDPPKRKHVVEYVQTFGAKKNTAEDFFRGSTLASYIVLNDSLRLHEEQFRKKVSFEFSSSSPTGPSAEFSKLQELLQATDFSNLKMPSKAAFVAQIDECKIAEMHPKCLIYSEKPALTGDVGILHSLDVSEYLVLHPSDSNHRPDEVRGGPKDALLVYATLQSTLLYQEAFIAAYRSFVDAKEVVQKLIERYLYMELSKDPESVRTTNQTFSVLVRIVDELCRKELDKYMVSTISSFVYHLVRQGNLAFARLLRRRLFDRLDSLNMNRPSVAVPAAEVVTPRKKPDTLFDFKSAHLAQQMTMIDADLFQKIELAEMLWWAEEQNDDRCPNLRKFTEHFNNISYWARTMVITLNEHRDREKMMHKFIKVMKQLRRIGNLHSYLAILSALDSGPVRRLDWPKSIMEHLNEHATIMDSSFSFKNYRQLLAETAPPCIPYIGLVLQDLTFIHVGNVMYLTKEQVGDRPNLINYNKIWQQYAIVDSIRKFKRWNYTFPRDDRVVRFYANFEKHLNEEETWQISEKIKPRKWGKQP